MVAKLAITMINTILNFYSSYYFNFFFYPFQIIRFITSLIFINLKVIFILMEFLIAIDLHLFFNLKRLSLYFYFLIKILMIWALK